MTRMRAPRTLLILLVVLGLGAGVAVARASSPPDLPPITAERLLASMLRAAGSPPPVSGEVAATIDLGIPRIAEGPAAHAASGIDALWGDHRLRVWRSSDGFRIADLRPTSERALIVDRRQRVAWTWDSKGLTAHRFGPWPVLDMHDHDHPSTMLDPMSLARRLLDAVDPSTEVRLAEPRTVAGRDAYVLVAEPRTTGTLIGRVEVAVDADRRLPLSVAVFARGRADAPLSAEYTRVSFEPIDPGTFAFDPPEGAKVTEHAPPVRRNDPPEGFPPPARVFGKGWTSVLAVRMPPEAVREMDPRLSSLLPFSGPLFSARIATTPSGTWFLVGMVPQSGLAAAEAELG